MENLEIPARLWRYFVLMILAASAFMRTASAAPLSCPPSPNVTTTIHDFDFSGTPFLLRSDDYNGSGQALYSAALDPNLSSTIYCGWWSLRVYSQSTRTVWITPNDPINSSQPAAPPASYYWQNVEGVSKCYDRNLNLVYYQNILTSSTNCSLNFDFGYNGVKYKLSMSPSLPTPGPATGVVTVTCNNVSAGQCVNWTLTPNLTASADNPAPTVANLYYYARGGKLTFIGRYYNTFRIDVM
jgi:hypothetical protein